MEFDVAAIIMGRREGETARASLRSFDAAVQAARAAGLRVQVIQHLDDPDPATLALFDLHRTSDTVQIVSTLREPGLARNVAIEAVEADHVALLDAGDLWCFDWLTTACDYLRASPAHVIAHPQFHFRFGEERRILRLPDQEGFEFDLDLMRLADVWNGIGVCRTSTLRSIPFRAGDHGQAVACVDWAWNLEAISAGHVHKIIPQTAIFRHVHAASGDVAATASLRIPPATVLSRYDSALYGSRALAAPAAVAHDGFLDAISDIDVVQLHCLFVGREPDDRSVVDTGGHGLASLANSLIRSDEFALRLHRLLDSDAGVAFADSGGMVSRDWLERRLGILVADSSPAASASAALAAALSIFPFQRIFDSAFGPRSAGLREGLRQRAQSPETCWRGYIDHCSDDLITGWVLAPGRSRPGKVAVRVGGVLAGVCEASQYRRDVAHAMGVDGLCGFELVPVIDWNQILDPRPVVTLHDVETGKVIPRWADMANQRRTRERGHGRNGLTGLPGIAEAPQEFSGGFPSVRIERYDALLSRHRIPAAPLPELFMRKPPTVSIVVHADSATIADLDATLQSVIAQSHAALQLVIVGHGEAEPTSNLQSPGRDRPVDVATVEAGPDARETFARVLQVSNGDYLCFVESGCMLDGAAIAWFVCAAQRFGARLIYADDMVHRYATAGLHRCRPDLKPSYDHDLLLQCDYMSAVFCASKADLAATMRLPKADGASRQYDLLLQLLEHVPEDCVFHVPLVLHARRDDDPAEPARPALLDAEQRRAVERHLSRTGSAAMLREAPVNARLDWTGSWYPHWSPRTPRQRLAIIIPTRDRVELLKSSVDSLQSMMADPGSCEILIMDNGSEDPATLEYLDLLRGRAGTRVVRSDGPFNWSALNNTAVTHTDAELLLFANNDIEVFTEGFDDILRGLLGRSDVGAVGTLLLYPNGLIQHAGTAIGIGGVADHIGAGQMPTERGVGRIARFERSVGAVTGAFLAVRRATFQQVGGFDEVDLKIAFSDVDLCLKIGAAGLRILYTPRVVCLHHESASRGLDTIDPEKNARANEEIRALKNRWGRRLDLDRHYNIGYDRSTAPFTTVRMPNASMVLDDLANQPLRKRTPDGNRA